MRSYPIDKKPSKIMTFYAHLQNHYWMPFVLVCRPITFTRLLLVKRGKGQRVILRHFAARVNLVNDLLKLPFTTTSLEKLYPIKSTPRPNLPSSHRRTQAIKPLPHVRTMSDDAYSSFLDKANQDTGASKASTQSKPASTKAVDTEVPATLQGVEQYYVSEADEPFEPVSLKWGGKNMPSESMHYIMENLRRSLAWMLTMCR